MATIQEVKYKKNKKEFTRYAMSIDKRVIEQLALKKGDELFFNGEIGEEIRFKIKRN